MKLAHFLSSAVVSAISVLGQTACSTTGAFTSYTDLALKVFYPGNPIPVLIYVENVLIVRTSRQTRHFIREFVRNTSPIGRKGADRNFGMHEHSVLDVQDVHDLGQWEAQTLGPGKHVLRDCFFACG